MSLNDDALSAARAMEQPDREFLAGAALRFPNLSRDEEHAALDACARLADLDGSHASTIWTHHFGGTR